MSEVNDDIIVQAFGHTIEKQTQALHDCCSLFSILHKNITYTEVVLPFKSLINYIRQAESFLRSYEVLDLSRNSTHFMESEGS